NQTTGVCIVSEVAPVLSKLYLSVVDVYSIALSCGKIYIGQRVRCLNDRLKEQKCKISVTGEPLLKAYWNSC
ncbi:uncharacterized protein LOC121835425, partial [Ixodes scapularis]|uniref:uncharacterized protein LOC121835425 n=1 Tax=Ixodes scapularis TaxID=6945 RepID=UPI001C3922E3